MSVPIKEVQPVKEKKKKKRKENHTTECVKTSRETIAVSLKQERGSAIHHIQGMSICHGKKVFFLNL